MDYEQLEGGPGRADNVQEGPDDDGDESYKGDSPQHTRVKAQIAANQALYEKSKSSATPPPMPEPPDKF